MKKIFSFVAAALFCATLSAQQLNEGFEGEGFPPEGWTVNNVNSYSGWTKGVKEGNNCAVVSGTYGTDINGSYLITPQLKPAAGEKLTFSARVSEYASKGQLRVEVSLTGTEISSFEILDTYYTSSNASTNKIWKTDWSTFTIDLSAYAGQRIFIAFHQYDDAEKIYLDNVTGVTIAGSATCDVPTNIVVSHVTDESATVSWEGEAAAYQYVLMPGGEAADWSLSELTEEKSV
ncbi:MAG: choice-of-anchor J domain-containing protein, partial [Paludibacteraceae bacterium]|nr:choice-of-anchor J domain-containing protein [Paludibacteraceae bacterium]